MYSGNAIQERYLETSVETAHPIQLIVMLYDGAVRFLQQGIEAIEARRIDDQNRCLVKTQNILAELMSSLNFEAGGEIAANLLKLYTYMYESLVQANLEDDADSAKKVLTMLDDLRDGWRQIAEQYGAEAARPQVREVSLHG